MKLMQDIDKTDEKPNTKQISKMSFQDIIHIILVHKWVVLLVFLVSLGATLYYVKTTPYVYQSGVFIMRETTAANLPANLMGIQTDYQYEEFDKSQDMLLRSLPMTQEIQKKLLKEQNININANQISGMIGLSSIKDSYNVMQLTAIGNSPKYVQAVANIAAEVYIAKSSQMKKSELSQGLDFLKQQMDQLESRITGTEKSLSTFKDKEGIIASTSETDSNGLLGKLGNIQSDLLQAENDAELTKTQLQTIEKLIEEKKKSAKTSSASGISSQLDQIREKIITLQLELGNKLETQTDKHPEIIAIKKKIEVAQAQLDSEFNKMLAETGTTSLDPLIELQDLMQQYVTLTVQLKSMEKRATLMKDRLSRFRSEHPELASKQVELMQLERQSRVYEQAYSTLTSKYEDMRLMEQMKVSGLKVINPAPLPGSPISPRVNMSLAMGALLGLLLE